MRRFNAKRGNVRTPRRITFYGWAFMREDFAKVVTERPRRGSRMRHKAIRRRYASDYDEDISGHKEGIRKPYGWNCKDFSDLIGPLHRFLMSRRGRKWDRVYSEVCERLKGHSTQQQHILDHLRQYVDTNVIFLDGKPTAQVAGCRRVHVKPGFLVKDFYVDPRDGKLKSAPKSKSWWSKPKAPDPNLLVKGDKRFERIGGNWFEITEITEQLPIVSAGDGVIRYVEVKKSQKRTLNGKELKALGLTNECDVDE